MKTLSRFFFAMVMVMLVAGSLITPVRADGPTQDLKLTDTETYVHDELLKGHEVDLTDKSGRAIRGEVIVAWWKDPTFKDITFFKIKNAIIDGNIDAEGVSLSYAVNFTHCTFTGNINLESAMTKTFRIDNDPDLNDPAFPGKINAPSIINDFVRMSRMIADGDVALYQSEFNGPVTLFDAQISGNLFAKDSQFRGTEWLDKKSKYPFELWKARVAQSTEFTGSTFKGEVSADYAVFGADVKFDGTTFEQPARFKNVQFNDIADFRGAMFKGLATFENSIVKRDIQFTNAQFNGRADFKYLSVGRFLNFSNAPLNAEDFNDKELKELKGTIFTGNASLEGVKVGDVLNFTNAGSAKPFEMHLAEVQGQTLFNSFAAPQGLDLSHNQFGDLIINGHTGGDHFKFLKVDSTKVNGDFELKELTLTDFSAQDLAVKNSTTFKQLKVQSELDLGNASLGSFTIDNEKFWPDPKTTSEALFNLRGTAYTDIGVSSVTNIEPQDQKLLGSLLKNMVAASYYSPQAYQTLEKILTEKGRSGDAADMEYDRKVRERNDKNILKPWSSPWLLSWFRFIFSGYGQHPIYALGWSMGIILISAFVFLNQGDLVKNNNDSRSKKFMYCFFFSMFLFFSFVVLEFTKSWEPEETETSFKVYKQFHKMLGLIIAPTAALVFGGIIK